MSSSGVFLVIMAGGSGTRFWPKSTAARPKQLLSFGSEDGPSLLGMTLSRFDGIAPSSSRIIVTTRKLRDSVSAVAVEAGGARVLAEPAGRNTAPCVYWAAREIAALDPRAVMLVMPADHYMAFPDRFRETVRAAVRWAETHDDLVTLGVRPTRPETGYGYLRIGDPLEGGACRRVRAFVEKPDRARAEDFLRSGEYYWNGGMFVWRAEVILRAFDEYMPEMRRIWDECQAEGGSREPQALVEAAYPRLTATSIDYGVMEKARNVVSFPLDCGWDDLGSWTSLEELADVLKARRPEGVVSAGEAIGVDSSGNIVDVPGKTVALLGVKDLIVVEAGGAVLIADKHRAQDIKLVIEELKKRKPELL